MGSESPQTEINMSPLIDIVFILLIFFVVTMVFIDEPGAEVKKPQMQSAEELEKDSFLLAVTTEGRIYHGGREVSLTHLRAMIASYVLENPELPVIIQGSEDATHGMMMKVVDAARLAGAKEIYQATASGS